MHHLSYGLQEHAWKMHAPQALNIIKESLKSVQWSSWQDLAQVLIASLLQCLAAICPVVDDMKQVIDANDSVAVGVCFTDP